MFVCWKIAECGHGGLVEEVYIGMNGRGRVGCMKHICVCSLFVSM